MRHKEKTITMNAKLTRRKVLKAFSGVVTGGVAGYFTSAVRSEERRSPNERPRVGVVLSLIHI